MLIFAHNHHLFIMEQLIIRKIQFEDNALIAQIIRKVLLEFGGDKPGTAYHDYDTDHMFEAYQSNNEVYYVAQINGKVVGGCGIKALKGNDSYICELQKLYILPNTRGLGIGKTLVEECLEFAIQSGYKKCYLETFPTMLAAINLYHKFGFQRLKAPLGETGHCGCDVWMAKDF
jgi:putative acetyltransferase